MKTQVPKVSVCLPVYNGERYLPELMESVLTQSFRDYEFLIADNASTDRTGQLCMAYAQRDPRVKYSKNNRNIGANFNSNLLFRRAQGEFVVLLGHDDIIRPQFLEKCWNYLQRDSEAVLCHTLTEFIGSDGQRLELAFPDARSFPNRDVPDEFRLYRTWPRKPILLNGLDRSEWISTSGIITMD